MQMLQEIWKSADSLKKDDLNALRKLTNYKKGSGVVNHVFSEEERLRLPDALRDAPSFVSQYAFSVNQVAEEKMIAGEQANLNALLLHLPDAASWGSIACQPADTSATYRAPDKGQWISPGRRCETSRMCRSIWTTRCSGPA
eukprot:6173266-Pleurochrysis_carterae.AAC.1